MKVTPKNNEWFKCPPPLLRTAVWMLAGTLSKLATISSIDLDSKSVPSTAAFNFVTYVYDVVIVTILMVLCRNVGYNP